MSGDIKDIVSEALDAVSSIESVELKLEAFKIILPWFLNKNLGQNNQISKLRLSQNDLPNLTIDTKETTNDYPVIVPSSSTEKNIKLLFDTDWGKTHRSSKEVNKALAFNNVADPKNASTRLRSLFKKRYLLCRNEGNELYYIKNPNPPQE